MGRQYFLSNHKEFVPHKLETILSIFIKCKLVQLGEEEFPESNNYEAYSQSLFQLDAYTIQHTFEIITSELQIHYYIHEFTIILYI